MMRFVKVYFPLLLLCSQIVAMQPAQPAKRTLSDFPFTGASVLVYTDWPSKPGINYFVLTREMAPSPDAGTYDAFGGRRDPNEKHPVETASRELWEESMGLLGTQQNLLNHINVKDTNPHTRNIIANDNKQVAIYFTHFDHKAVEHLTKNFYKPAKGREKDMIAHVTEDKLRSAIANAERYPKGHPQQGQLKQPIEVDAQVIYPGGTRQNEKIKLRPVLVSALQSYFKGTQNFTSGKDPRIRFYDR